MFDPQAAWERGEAATEGPWEASEEIRTHAMVVFQPENGGLIIHDGECLSNADAEFIAHARSDLPAALEALEEAQGENRQLKEKIDRWVQAYSPDIITYPSAEAVRAVNTTPEFVVGRNATMQAVHDGLARILRGTKEGE